MLIRVYETSNGALSDCLGIVDEYTSLNFTKSFKNTGSFVLKGNYSKEIEELLKPDRIICITPNLCGVIHSIEVRCEQNGEETYTAYGTELKGIFAWRIVWNTYAAKENLSSYVGALIEKNAFKGSRKLIDEIVPSKVKGRKIEKQVSYKNLQEVIEELIQSENSENNLPLGYDVYLSQEQDKILFEVVEGEDRTSSSNNPVIFSRSFDNITNMTYTISRKNTANAILCAGEGEGANRKKIEVFDGAPQGFSRKECFVDAKDIRSTYKNEQDKEITLTPVEYESMLATKAKENLFQEVRNVDANAVLLEDATGLLGAKVTVLDKKLNVATDDYIAEINLIDEADGLQTTLSIGKDIQARRLL